MLQVADYRRINFFRSLDSPGVFAQLREVFSGFIIVEQTRSGGEAHLITGKLCYYITSFAGVSQRLLVIGPRSAKSGLGV